MLGQIHDSDIKLLRVFAVVARSGGFSAAQAELNISQAFISTQMKNLEERLGTRLCQRGQAGFKLTDAGAAVLASAERLFLAMEQFKVEATTAVDPLSGVVKLGVVDQLVTSDECQVAAAISRFVDVAPNSTVEISIVPPLALETSLLSDEIDIAYGIYHHRISALEYLTVGAEQHELYCSDSHPLHQRPESEISQELIAESPYVGWDYMESGELFSSALERQIRAASPFVEAVLYYILSGKYIGHLPAHMAAKWVADGKLRSLRADLYRREVAIELVIKRGAQMSPIATVFRDCLLNIET